MSTPTLDKQSKDYLNNKINLMFRRDNLPPEAKDDYFRQANEFQLKTGSLKNFHYENDNFKIENQTPSPNNKDDEEKLSYAMKLDKEGNIQATDNKGNKLKPCSPEEMIKKIVQNFKSQNAQSLTIKHNSNSNQKPDERITSIFARECIMNGIAPNGDLPKSSAFWASLQRDFLQAGHSLEEWNKLTGHISEAHSEKKCCNKCCKHSSQNSESAALHAASSPKRRQINPKLLAMPQKTAGY